jgi:hypothetical protein
MATIQQLEDAIVRARAAGDEESSQYLLDQRNQKLEEKYGPTVESGRRGKAGFFENVGTGLASGAIGMYESAALGGAALLEEEEELKARDKIQSVASSFRPDGGDKESLTYKLASGIGSIGALLPTALLGPAALPAAAAIAGGAGAGEASERARDFGATEEERSSATFRGSLIGLTELAPLGRIAKGLQIPGVAKVLEKVDANDLKGIKNRIRSVATTGVAEGAQEAAAAILQNLNARGYDAEAELIDAGVLDEATIGGGAGAIIQALADVIAGRRGGKSVSTEGVEEVDDKSDEQAVEEVFGLPALPKTVNVVMPDGTVRENVPMDDPDAIAMIEAQKKQSALSTEEIKGEMETDARRDTERAAILEAQDREQGLASLVKDDAAEQARRQTGDLFPLEKATAEREAARVAARAPEDMSDAEMADAMAEQDVETERARRLEDDDQIKPDGDMVDRARYEELQDKQIDERTAAEDIELEQMQRDEDAAKEADDLEVERMVIADENKTAQSELEAQVKERGPKQTQQQQPLGGIQTKSSAKKQGVRRNATETAEAYAAEKNIPLDTITPASGKQITLTDVRVAERQKATGMPTKKTADLESQAGAVQPLPKEVTQQLKGLGITIPTITPKAAPKTKTPPAKTAPKTEAPADTSTQEAPADIGGDIEFPTAVPRGTEFTNPDDVTALTDLVTKPIPRDQKGMELTAQTYIKRFKRPADAFEAIAFEIAENTPKFREQKGTPTSEKAKFAGTGGANTKTTLQWIEKNLSPDAKAEIDRRIVEQQKKSTDVEKDTKARATQERDDTKVKQRETKIAQDVDTATDGKAKVVGTSTPSKATSKVEPSPTARADAATKKKASGATKKEDVVSQAIENVQGRKGKNATAPLTEDMSPDQLRARIAADTAKFVAGGGKIDVLNLELDPKVALELSEALPKDVKELLKKGDLKGALQSLAKSTKSKRVKQIARALSENTGTTKIELANEASLKDKGYEIGDKGDVAGLFDPRINTVILNSNMPLTIHALLHETTHAATINQLKNKSHPATKQLEKLYKDVKPYLDTAYGAENLNEFIAEAFSNPVFQRKLASINPKGEDISALERFYRAVTNYVRRLIGMDTKPVGSALDEADAAIMAMLSPNMATSNDPVMNMVSTPDGVRKVLNDMTDIQKRVSEGSKKSFLEGATDFLNGTANRTAKDFLLKLTGSQALGDIARNNGFGQLGLKLHELFEEQRGSIQKSDEKINKVLAAYDAWAKKNLEQKQLLDNIIYSQEHGATIYQVDPTLTRAEAKKRYGNQTAQDDRNLFEVWEANQEQWKNLKDGGRKQFTELRNTYKRMHEDLVAVINREIDAIGDGKDNASKIKLKKQMNERLISSNTMEVYFPLVRQGNYKLSYATKIKNDDGTFREESVFLMFEAEGARDSAAKEVENDALTVAGTVESYDGDTKASSYRSPPAGSFVADVLDVIAANVDKGKRAEVEEQIMRLFIETLPETSFAKSLQRRKNTLGYIQDARLGMQTKGFDLGAQIEKMRYGGEIRAVEKSIDLKHGEGAPKSVNKNTFNAVYRELGQRAKFAREGAANKGPEQYYQRANQTAFIYTIGFNASSALVNLSQIPLVVGPYLTSKFGAVEASIALGRASKFVGASKISIDEYYDIKEVSTTDADGVISREDVYTLKADQEKKIRDTSVDKEEADAKIKHFNRMIPLVKMARERGQIHHSTIADQLGVNDAGRQKNKNPALRFLDGTSALSAVMFNAAERFNRQTTVAASYDLNLDKLDAMHEAKGDKRFYSAVQAKFIDVPSSSEARMQLAADEALYFAQETNGGSVLETAAGYSQQGVGRVALMYKSYGLQMYYTMIKSAVLAGDNMFAKDAEGKELRNMALKQAMGVHLSALFFAGVQGLPLYGMVSMIWNMFLDNEEDDARTITRKYLGEGWYKGGLTALTGTDVASRVSLSNLLLQENRFNKDPSLEESLGFYLGGPALSTGTRLKRAYDDLNSSEYGSFERGIESLMPAGLTNAWRSTLGRYAREGGIRSRRKDPIYDDMTVGDFAAQALGFPPAEYTYRQEMSGRNKGVEKAVTEKRSMLTKKFYVAQRMGDHETMIEVLKDISAHNKRHPTAALTGEQISKSVKSHMKTSADMHNGVTVNPIMKYAIMRSNMDYNKGY